MIYNSMMGEFAGEHERARVTKGLNATTKDRKGKDEETASTALDSVWQEYKGKYSVPQWEEYKREHQGELEGILEALSETVKTSISDDEKWREAMVAGVDLSDEFGDKEAAANNALIQLVMLSAPYDELTSGFEKEVLFRRYKDNSAYKHDFWKD